MRNNEKVILLALASLAIFGISYYISSPPFERIDVIGKDSFSFKLQKILPNGNMVGQAYIYSKKSNLAIDNIPESITMICNNRKSFTIDIENKDASIARNVNFVVEDAEKLKFEYPTDFIIPPHSSRKMTLFVDADCSNAPNLVHPIFKIEGTELNFGFDVNVYDRAE